MRRPQLVRVLAIVALAVAGLGAGPAGHAATTTTLPAKYNYDDPAAFVLGADSSPLRLAASSAARGAQRPANLAAFRFVTRAGVAAEEGRAAAASGGGLSWSGRSSGSRSVAGMSRR
jgi:hypothetical protein